MAEGDNQIMLGWHGTVHVIERDHRPRLSTKFEGPTKGSIVNGTMPRSEPGICEKANLDGHDEQHQNELSRSKIRVHEMRATYFYV
jgi:hypothetical protein